MTRISLSVKPSRASQKIKRWPLIIAILCFLVGLVYLNQAVAKHHNRQHFIQFMLPLIQAANQQIDQNRELVLGYYREWQVDHHLHADVRQWLNALAEEYGLKAMQWQRQQNWQQLLRRVDIIPPSLALAQAINETAWGRSRFAQQGNNYFGLWCYRVGCGLVPSRRPAGEQYEVRKFTTPLASVQAYMHVLNSKKLYYRFRRLRARLRAEQQPLMGEILVEEIDRYNPGRKAYVKIIRSIIDNYDLEQYDI